MDKLSVIIPVYNSASTLERCVNSVLSQNLDNYEIILVDDGSTQDCARLCDDLAAQSPAIRVIHRPNGGLSAARNTGIEAFTGNWLSFIDSADEITPGTLSTNLEWLESNPGTDLLEFPVHVHYGSPDSYLLSFKPETITGDQVFQHWIENQGYTHCYAWNKIYKRELFDDIRFPVGQNFEDTAICPSIIRKCHTVTYSDKGLYLYYKSVGSITLQYRFKNQEPLFRHNLELLQLITGLGLGNEISGRLWNLTLNLLIDLARCKDADKKYIAANAVALRSIKPARALRQADSFKQKLKVILGPKAACSLLNIRKYS